MIENLECRRFRNRIDAFIDNELSASEREEMLRHAKQCPECGKLLNEYQDMLSLMQKMDEETVIPQEAAQAWRSAVRDEAEHTRRSASRGWMRALGSVAAAFVLLLGVTGLYRSGYNPAMLGTNTSSAYYTDSYDGAYYAENTMMFSTASAGYGDSSVKSTRTVFMETDGAVESGVVVKTDSAETERKPVIVRSATRSMQSTAFDADSASIEALVTNYEGWFGYRSLTGKSFADGGTGRTLELSIRIPTEMMDDFLTDMHLIGVTVHMADHSDDISSEYYDTSARLDALKAQRDRLVELVDTATDLDDLISLEDKLYEVQAEIDYLEGNMRDMSSRVSYSTITVTVVEVREYTEPEVVDEPLVDRIKNGFRDSIEWVVSFLQDMVVAVVAFAPTLVIFIPAFVIILLVIRALRRRRRR